MHKSGFVNIIGNPNVGKSTLMNALVGEKLSIITSKAQTTRHRIMGIVSGEDFQIVYSDTPGILKPSYKLQESMMKFVTGAVTDADVILYVTDTVEQGDRSAENHRPHPGKRHSDRRGDQQDRPLDARSARRAGGQVAAGVARSADRTRIGQGKLQYRGVVQNHPRPAARRSGVLPERDADGQDAAFLRIGNHPRKRSSNSTTRRSPTAAKSRSTATGRNRRSTASPRRSTSPATRRKAS